MKCYNTAIEIRNHTYKIGGVVSKQNMIFFIVSPYRASCYDWNNLILPENVLVFIAQNQILKNNLEAKGIRCIEIPTKPYQVGMEFLDIEHIDKYIDSYIEEVDIILHSEEEFYLDHIAVLNQKYKLNGFDEIQMSRFRNKYIMKSSISTKPEHFIVPKYTNDNTKILDIGFPAIIKPVDMGGGYRVKKLESKNDLEEYLSLYPDTPYIIEEFITGDLILCDLLVYNGEILKFMFSQSDSVEFATKNKSYISAEIINDQSIIDLLKPASLELVKLLEINRGMIHLEFIVNSNGAHFIEVGIRPGGGPLYQMYQMCYGVNIYNLHLYTSYLDNGTTLNNYISQHLQQNKYCACFYFLRQNENTIEDFYIPKLDCSNQLTLYKETWSARIKTNSLADRVANILLFGNDAEEYLKAKHTLIEQHRISYKV